MTRTTTTPATGSTTESTTPTTVDSTSEQSSSSTTTADSSPDSSSPTPTDPQQPDPDDAGEDDEASPNREAARYRVRLREAEAELDKLTEKADELRSQVERLQEDKLLEAVGGRVNLAALRGLGADLSGIIAADGTSDNARVRALLREHNLHKGAARKPNAGTGQHGDEGAPTWADAVRERNR